MIIHLLFSIVAVDVYVFSTDEYLHVTVLMPELASLVVNGTSILLLVTVASSKTKSGLAWSILEIVPVEFDVSEIPFVTRAYNVAFVSFVISKISLGDSSK